MELLLLTVYLLLQVGDWWTTTKVLSQGGTEANPIVREVMSAIGVVPALVVVKSIGVIAGVLIWYADQSIFLVLLCCLYGYVVYKNYTHIK